MTPRWPLAALLFVAACAPPQPAVVATAPCEPAPAPAPPPAEPELLEQSPLLAHARAIVKALNDGQCGALTARFNPNMKEALPADKLAAFCTGFREARGLVTAFEIRRIAANEARFSLTAEKGPLRLRVAIDDDGTIAGFTLRPPPAEPPPVETAGPYALPVEGTWSVFWGGDNLRDNAHVASLNQRRAADLVVRGPDGKTHSDSGAKNEDYLAYGEAVLAVADGTVVTVVDGVPDNPPGRMNEYVAVGNMVVIQHAGSAFSVYAHLKPGSIRVREGQKVPQGQRLGDVGNSGRSSEPHLHFHVQSKRALPGAIGVEAIFSGVEVERDGAFQPAADYRFKRGDTIRPGK